MSSPRRPFVPAILALAACGGDSGGPITELTIDTLADGSVLVSNPPHGLWDGTPDARWRLVERLRIGSAVTREPDAFGNVISLTIDELDRLWIADSEAREVRVFDADGRFVRAIGQPGEGPGEFGRIASVGRGPEGHMWIADTSLGRYEVFDTAGTRIGGHRMPLRNSGFWLSGLFFQVDFPEQTRARVYRIHRLADSGTLEPDGRVFGFPELPPDPPMIEYRDGGRAWTLPAPYTRNYDWVLGSDLDLWWSNGEDRGGRYEIRRIDLTSGDTLRTIVRQYEPVAISDAVRVAGVEAALQNVRVDRGLWSAERPSERAMRVVPRVYPPFQSFYRSRDGTLWVRRYIGEGVQSFDIFDEQGRLLGQPELPAGFGSMSVRSIREDRMYVIDTDELGVDYVVRLEIVKSG